MTDFDPTITSDAEAPDAEDAAQPGVEDAEALAAARRHAFERLPPEIQANPAIRRRFGIEDAPLAEPEATERFGLGDAVAIFAKPLARALGRDPNCKPCAQRQAALNRMMSVTVRRRRRGPI